MRSVLTGGCVGLLLSGAAVVAAGELVLLGEAELAPGGTVPAWRLVTDQVMGGVSSGQAERSMRAGRACLRLTGTVRTANNGGFIQLQRLLDRALTEPYAGVRLVVLGNGAQYAVHLKTSDLDWPWQSYRAPFQAVGHWQEWRIPFHDFRAHRTERALVLGHLQRIGLVAIGRPMPVDLCVAELAFYP